MKLAQLLRPRVIGFCLLCSAASFTIARYKPLPVVSYSMQEGVVVQMGGALGLRVARDDGRYCRAIASYFAVEDTYGPVRDSYKPKVYELLTSLPPPIFVTSGRATDQSGKMREGLGFILMLPLPPTMQPSHYLFFGRSDRYCSVLTDLLNSLTLGIFADKFGTSPRLSKFTGFNLVPRAEGTPLAVVPVPPAGATVVPGGQP